MNEQNIKIVDRNELKGLYGGIVAPMSKWKDKKITATPDGPDYEKEKTIDD